MKKFGNNRPWSIPQTSYTTKQEFVLCLTAHHNFILCPLTQLIQISHEKPVAVMAAIQTMLDLNIIHLNNVDMHRFLWCKFISLVLHCHQVTLCLSMEDEKSQLRDIQAQLLHC